MEPSQLENIAKAGIVVVTFGAMSITTSIILTTTTALGLYKLVDFYTERHKSLIKRAIQNNHTIFDDKGQLYFSYMVDYVDPSQIKF